MLKKYLFVFLLCFFSANFAHALDMTNTTDHVRLTIIPEYTSISKETQQITLISAIDIKPEWHLYWDNPGDTGDPTSLTFFDSPFYQKTSENHSAPQKILFNNLITTYVHHQKLYYKTSFELNNLAQLTELPFTAVLSYSVCKEECLPETITLNFSIPFKELAFQNQAYLKHLFIAENTFPLPLEAKIKQQGNSIELEIAQDILQNCSSPEFVSIYSKKNIIANLPKTEKIKPNFLHVSFDDNELPKDTSGLILCDNYAYLTPSFKLQELSLSNTSQTEFSHHLWYYLFTAFIAGLILNLMPCVLPILSLKALYLAAHKEKASFNSALIYMLGVLCSFLILAGILFYLKNLGSDLGWGFQLQSPFFNIILFILFFLIFLMLIDKLTLPNSFANKLDKIAHGRSFLTGFFAVIIACPCTGPFMGAALGYAITKPALIYFSIFISLSLGYALPYALIESYPAFFLKFIPKPGAWMQKLKHILSIPIALTCLWLIWITAHQLSLSQPKAEINWENYTPQAVEQALNQGDAVLIDFTAKWCLICLLNDKTTLSTDDFKQLAQSQNIRLFKADWTSRNKKIGDALKIYGRNSIPLYIYYKKGEKTPQYLPQILTLDALKQMLK